MKNVLISLLVAMTLIGCGTDPVKLNTAQLVDVPIVTKCTPKQQITPITDHPMDRATKEMPLFEKSQLALSEALLYKGQNKELTAALAECTK